MSSLKALTVAVCCCCVICHSLAKPSPAAELNLWREALKLIKREYYDDKSETRDGQSVEHLVQQGLKDFDFDKVARLPKSNRTAMIRAAFDSFYLGRAVNTELSAEMRQLIRNSLGIGNAHVSISERNRLAETIPHEIIDRVNSWNSAVAREKKETNEIEVIGQREDAGSGISFVLSSELLSSRVLHVSLGVHLTEGSRRRLANHRLEAELLTTSSSSSSLGFSKAGFSAPVNSSSSSEIFINVSSVAASVIRSLAESNVPDPQLHFRLVDEISNESVDASFVVMDTRTAPFGAALRRQRRSPFENETSNDTVEEFEEWRRRAMRTHDCQAEHMQSRFGRKACCLMSVNYDLAKQPEVIAPKRMRIKYCAGQCLSDAYTHDPHSALLQMMANSQRLHLSHEIRQDISLCCVPRTYRDYKILVVLKLPNNKQSVEIRRVERVSAESCTCS